VIVEFIDAHREEYGVEPICEQLQIAPSSYYAHRTRPPSARSVTDAATTTLIERVHADSYGVYGARKVHAEVRRQGHPVARCAVEWLMRRAGLRGLSRAKGPRTTVPSTGPDTRPDLVERAFTATGPDQPWVADITYCRTFSGWVYAAFVTDVYSRRVVGWQLSRSLRTDLALDALEMGIWTAAGPDGTSAGSFTTRIRACNTSRCATPSVSLMPAQWPRSAPPATPTTLSPRSWCGRRALA